MECKYLNDHPQQLLTPPDHPSSKDSITSAPESNRSPSQRILELELMHQWTSATYKSYCGTYESEYHAWQVLVPRMALKHDFLLHTLFAMSALELADTAESAPAQDYVHAALDYQSLSSSGLRNELSSIDLKAVPQEQHQALYAASSILMILALALPRFLKQPSERTEMLESMLTYIELLKGLVVVFYSRNKDHRDDPLMANYKTWDELPVKPIDSSVKEALDRLIALNEEVHGFARTDHRTPELQAMTYHAACRKAIFYLQECWERCSSPDTRGYMLAFLLQAGEDFIMALKEKEAVAVLITMHWGVLLESQSYDIWWARDVGKSLVEELSDILGLPDNENSMAGLRWTREQVGLSEVP